MRQFYDLSRSPLTLTLLSSSFLSEVSHCRPSVFLGGKKRGGGPRGGLRPSVLRRGGGGGIRIPTPFRHVLRDVRERHSPASCPAVLSPSTSSPTGAKARARGGLSAATPAPTRFRRRASPSPLAPPPVKARGAHPSRRGGGIARSSSLSPLQPPHPLSPRFFPVSRLTPPGLANFAIPAC